MEKVHKEGINKGHCVDLTSNNKYQLRVYQKTDNDTCNMQIFVHSSNISQDMFDNLTKFVDTGTKLKIIPIKQLWMESQNTVIICALHLLRTLPQGGISNTVVR